MHHDQSAMTVFHALKSARSESIGPTDRGARMRKRLGIALVAGLVLSAGIGVAQAQTMRQACAADYQSYCSGVQPGGGRIIACFQKNASKLSPDCRKALEAAKAQKSGAPS